MTGSKEPKGNPKTAGSAASQVANVPIRNFNATLGSSVNYAERRWEEKAIFCLASCFSRRFPDLKADRDTIRRLVSPQLEGSSQTATLQDKEAAFALIGQRLSPLTGPDWAASQISPLWLTFRRLFLEITENPANLRLREPQGLRAQRLQVSNGPEGSKDSKLDLVSVPDSDPAAEIGNPFLRWNRNFHPQLDYLRKIAQARLDDYSNLNLASAKAFLIENEGTFIGPECGFLEEVVTAFNRDWISVLTKRDRSDTAGEQTTESILREMVSSEKVIPMDFDRELDKARRSVRAVLFDLAVERILGSPSPKKTDIWMLERDFRHRRLIEDPYSMINDERIAGFVADELAFNGKKFASSLLTHFQNLTDHEDRHHRWKRLEVKRRLTLMWIDPDRPLWLMATPAIELVLKHLLSQEVSRIVTEDLLREHWKQRTDRIGSPLEPASKNLIIRKKLAMGTPVHHSAGVSRAYEIGFPGYIVKSVHFQRLRSHCQKLGMPWSRSL